MPNTDPPVDSVAGIKFLLATARTEGVVNVFPLGCITKGRKGEELAEIGKMHRAGIVGITDDGSPVMNSQIMRHALEYVRMAGIPVVSHCEDLYLSQNGVMNEGYLSTVMGLKGIPAQAETTMIARDIALAELTGGHLHIAHVSSAGSVTLIREAKRRKLSVTGETAPHYFSLTEEAVSDYNTMAKVNPPLRSHADVRAIIRGLKDGTIDAIASDHAPHTEEEKQTEFNTAPAGLIGLETTVPIVFTYLVKKKLIDLKRAVELMSSGPAGIFGLKRGTLSPGAVADVTIIDPRRELVINKEWFVSKSRNSPFIGKKLTGFAEAVFVSGKQVLS
jgi:dihydroorotase